MRNLAISAGTFGVQLTLPFLALPVISEVRLTDRGLVDVNRSCFVSLKVEQTLAMVSLMLRPPPCAA
jgi:adenine deaminase